MPTPFLHTKRGFTLIELIIVVAIIALLSSIALTQFSEARMKARDTRRIEDITQIQRALELYYHDNGEYPHPSFGGADGLSDWFNSTNSAAWNALAAELAPYISTLPTDPINSGGFPFIVNPVAPEFSYAYQTNAAGAGAAEAAQVYDLITQFEDVENPNRCGVRAWISNTERNTTDLEYGQPWCAGPHGITPNLEGYSQHIYAAH